MYSWIKQIGITVQTVYNVAILVINFFIDHIIPLFLFLKQVVLENGHLQFPLALATLAGVVGICMVIRFLWNAIRGSGA